MNEEKICCRCVPFFNIANNPQPAAVFYKNNIEPQLSKVDASAELWFYARENREKFYNTTTIQKYSYYLSGMKTSASSKDAKYKQTAQQMVRKSKVTDRQAEICTLFLFYFE